jgi:transposase
MSKEADWAAQVEAWRSSGMSAREFCKDRGYSATTLYWWASQLKRRGAATQRGEGIALARVTRKADTRSRPKAPSVVVEVGQARIEVGADVDRSALSAVLEVLASVRWEPAR